MSAEQMDSAGDDDLEMLEAIRAAFGDEALGMLASDSDHAADESFPSGEHGEQSASRPSLDALVREIDNATVRDAAPSNGASAVKDDTQKHIVVEISGRVFGVPMANVHEIQRVPKITFLPGVPDWVLGVTNLRGNVVSVVELRQLLGLPAVDSPIVSRRLVMTHSLVDEVATGLIVDRVIGIRNLSQSKVIKTTAPVNDQVACYLTGMWELNDQLVALLDIDKLLLSEEFRQFDAA